MPLISLVLLFLFPFPCAHLQLSPGAMYERKEALCSLHLCREHQLLEIFRRHVQVGLGTGGNGGYDLSGQTPQAMAITQPPTCPFTSYLY